MFFFFQAEDGIRDYKVTGVQTCALPIYPARAVADADHAHHALHARVDGRRPHDGRAAIARAVDAEPRGVHLGQAAEEGQRRLHVGHAAIWRQAAARPFAVAPALVVERQYDVARLVEDARV